MNRHAIIEQSLQAPSDAIKRTLCTLIREARPDWIVDEAESLYSSIAQFHEAGRCVLSEIDGFTSDYMTYARRGEIVGYPKLGWWNVSWRDHNLELVILRVTEGYHSPPYTLIIAPSKEVLHSFLIELKEFSSNLEGTVLVFEHGCWHASKELFEDIQASTFDNLILPSGLADAIRADLQNWLDSRELYEKHGIPWKRGLILVGPPGNGKTHIIKALVNHFKLIALYVRSFKAEQTQDAENISKVFEHARECAPSLLILEDLDTLVNSGNRSFFLNELDGFARNTGILVVASANDPERLDPALVNRPSRFDRRYTFELPQARERARYLKFFTSSLNESLQLSDEEAMEMGEATEGFSYAYLKELVLSSMMAWISHNEGTSFSVALAGSIDPLRSQISSNPTPTPELPATQEGVSPWYARRYDTDED